MKPRKFNRRLVLNKKTIAHLNGNHMRFVNGGGDAPPEVEPVTFGAYTCVVNCTQGCTVGCCTQGTSAGGACC